MMIILKNQLWPRNAMGYQWKLEECSFDKEKWELELWSKRRLLFLSKRYNDSNAYPILVHNNRISPHILDIVTFPLVKDYYYGEEADSAVWFYEVWAANYHRGYFREGKFVMGVTPHGEVWKIKDFKFGLNQYFCMVQKNFAGETLTKLITDSNLPQTHIDAVRDLWE